VIEWSANPAASAATPTAITAIGIQRLSARTPTDGVT
jgi:hypothetical protein